MTNIIGPRKVIIYRDRCGREPFTIWLKSIKNPKSSKRIWMRLHKLEKGIYGDCKQVGEGVIEQRIFYGPGYRVYFAEDGNNIVVLLGGNKNSQQNDIERARDYWKAYKGCR
ncbi:type II toxin-antitoxin system RelE/ParE family toxin [Ktedonosporobacter rubrisoli]|uniref:Type II toxin-antitoxin system RelE/ParE family toxin n=1 Tax=Ktedonosporobacter rubrisoli TaxID=2509675 RepID=A0A4P6JL01_KTERU|nr:type II toxin-antitoxin system RelE/ParE family toxin [Ktedonosporobacter rubrisoli]